MPALSFKSVVDRLAFGKVGFGLEGEAVTLATDQHPSLATYHSQLGLAAK